MQDKIEVNSPLYTEGEDAPEKSVPQSHPEFYDYKNVWFLKSCIMETRRILPRRTTGLNAKQQRQLTRSIKVAKFCTCYDDRHPDTVIIGEYCEKLFY